jgi:hypothetical protein
MGVWESSCLGGAQYSLPEQANLTLIFFPKIVGEGGGGHQKFFSGHTQKKIFWHTYKHSTKFFRHSKKNSRNFRKDTKIFLRHQNFSEIFMFCPNFAVPDRKHFGGTRAPPHVPRPIRLWIWVLHSHFCICHSQPKYHFLTHALKPGWNEDESAWELVVARLGWLLLSRKR